MKTQKPKKFSAILESQREKYANAYKPWTGEDDLKFETLRLAGKNATELADVFGRNKGAIRSRLKKFSLEKLKNLS